MFLNNWGVRHRISSTCFPQVNGRAEVAMRKYKPLLMDNIKPNGSLDNDAFLRAHVRQVVAKTTKNTNIVKALSGINLGCRNDTLRSLYLTYIRSACEYAGGRWMPSLSDSNMEKLEIVQRKIARIITGCVPSTNNDARIREANLLSFKYRLRNFINKSLRVCLPKIFNTYKITNSKIQKRL